MFFLGDRPSLQFFVSAFSSACVIHLVKERPGLTNSFYLLILTMKKMRYLEFWREVLLSTYFPLCTGQCSAQKNVTVFYIFLCNFHEAIKLRGELDDVTQFWAIIVLCKWTSASWAAITYCFLLQVHLWAAHALRQLKLLPAPHRDGCFAAMVPLQKRILKSRYSNHFENTACC